MCNGMILANGEKCYHEAENGDCLKNSFLMCPESAEYCKICGTFFDENNKCDCSEEE